MIQDLKKDKSKLVSLLTALAFLAVLVILTVRYTHQITELVRKPEEFAGFISSYGYAGVLVFMLFQVLQVVIAAIPGELVQIAGGYVYGTVLGTVYSAAGILIGSALAFYGARLVGLPVVRLFVSEKNLEKFQFVINSKKSETLMFLLFLIPGIPKDILVYVAGVTPIESSKFFIIVTLARLPGLLGASFIGANIYDRNYGIVAVVSVISVLLFLAGLLYKERIMNWIEEVFHRNHKSEP